MYSFGKERRILTKKQFKNVFSSPVKVVMPAYVLISCANVCGFARLGLALSKKMVAKAVARTRLKRIFREDFRQRKLAEFDVVIVARKSLNYLSNEDLRTSLDKAWVKLNNLHAK